MCGGEGGEFCTVSHDSVGSRFNLGSETTRQHVVKKAKSSLTGAAHVHELLCLLGGVFRACSFLGEQNAVVWRNTLHAHWSGGHGGVAMYDHRMHAHDVCIRFEHIGVGYAWSTI